MGHTESVTGVTWSHKDQELVSVGYDKTLRLWDIENSTEKIQPVHHTGRLSSVAVDGGSKNIVCGSTDGCSIVFDYHNQHQIMYMRNGGPVTDVAIDNTGFLIAVVNDINCELNVWDLRNGKSITRMQDLHRSTPTSCVFTPDYRSIITTSTDGSVKSVDYIRQHTLITLRDHKHAVSSACLTLDGKILATTSWDRSILLYDLLTGAYRSQGPTSLTGAHQGSISCSSISTAGDILVTGGLDKLVVIWDPQKGHQVMRLSGHTDWVNQVKLSTDERIVLSASKCSLCEKYFTLRPTEKRTGRPRCPFCWLETEPRNH
ncbi:putative Wd40 protein [Fasciolopsis buskii]|uniref:Putative Wd40 protein n=1 Tax=Fasciolopsis buskii TaxID=27845 RepID=A0A8E0S0B2_9TREM|nr:putative Wd40 protein [Fasciolopsis buski]